MPKLTPIYVGHVLERLIRYIDKRVEQSKCYSPTNSDKRFSLRKLARDTGIDYGMLLKSTREKKRRLSTENADRIMYVLGISILDLVGQQELLTHLATRHNEQMKVEQRYHLRLAAKNLGVEIPNLIVDTDSKQE